MRADAFYLDRDPDEMNELAAESIDTDEPLQAPEPPGEVGFAMRFRLD